YRWGSAPGMPPLPALTFFAFGGYLVYAAWKRAEATHSRLMSHYLGLSLAVATTLTTIIFWQALLGRERLQLNWTPPPPSRISGARPLPIFMINSGPCGG